MPPQGNSSVRIQRVRPSFVGIERENSSRLWSSLRYSFLSSTCDASRLNINYARLSLQNPDLIHQVAELIEAERLLSITQSLVGLRVNLNHQAIRTHTVGRQRQRSYEISSAGGMRRVDNDWQVGEAPENRDCGQIERTAGDRFKCTNSSLTEYDLLISLYQNVLRSVQKLLERGRHAAL